MRLPRLRFTVRLSMLLILLVGLASAGLSSGLGGKRKPWPSYKGLRVPSSSTAT